MAGHGVSNSSPIIVLKAAGLLDILPACFQTVLVPDEVANEIRDFPAAIADVRAIRDRRLFRALCLEIDPGEAAAITLACETPGAAVILDDKKGRRVARNLGLPVVGTIGLIIEAKRIGAIERARPAIEALCAVGLYASDEVIQRALKEAQE
jgi:predicted nucleic acid-binding protein